MATGYERQDIVSLTKQSTGYTGAAGATTNVWTEIAYWQTPSQECYVVDPSMLMKFEVNDTTPAQITTGQVRISRYNPSKNVRETIYEGDLGEIPSWANQQSSLYTMRWGNKAVIPSQWYLSVEYKSTTASVAANCKYALQVLRIQGITDAEMKQAFKGLI